MKKDISKLNIDTETDNFALQDYILSPDEELANSISFDELLVGVKEDLKEFYQKHKLYRK